jgi:hypothetical protein
MNFSPQHLGTFSTRHSRNSRHSGINTNATRHGPKQHHPTNNITYRRRQSRQKIDKKKSTSSSTPIDVMRNLNAIAAIIDKNADYAGDLLIPFVDNYE